MFPIVIFDPYRAPQILIHLFLLIETVFAWSAIHKQKKASDDRQDLKEIVFGKIFVRVAFVELQKS
jgi:hypothetical protein